MHRLEKGCLVRCIEENNSWDVPITEVGSIYTVIDYNKNHWLKLKEPRSPQQQFKFDVKRFEFYEKKEAYPTINESYFK